jgi:hypothetical protein
MPPPTRQEWWVLSPPTGPKTEPYKIVESPTKPKPTAQWVVAAGPFPNQAAAQTWVKDHTKNPFPFPHFPNPFGFLAWIQDIGHWVGIAVANITDIHMWISLGWLALGGFLVVIGLWLWVRGTKFYQELQQQATTAAMAAAA